MAFLQNICSQIVSKRSANPPLLYPSIHSIPNDLLPSILSPYSSDSIYEIDSTDFLQEYPLFGQQVVFFLVVSMITLLRYIQWYKYGLC